MRWSVGIAGVFMWIAVLMGSVSAQRINNDASLRDSIAPISKRPVTPAPTVKRPSPAADQSQAATN